MDTLLQLDINLFLFINQLSLWPIINELLVWSREPLFWIPLYCGLIAYYFNTFGKKGYYLLLFTILTVASSDLLSSRVVKPLVQRDRPCQVMTDHSTNTKVDCGSGYSFTSSHATNHMALAIFLFITIGRRIKQWKWILICWAGLIGFAQIYVGLHYPLDVLAGFLLGFLIGKGWGTVYNKFWNKDH